MIRLNKMTDYAVVLMTELALSHAVVTAGDLARRTGIPQPTVAKLLKRLTQGGLAVAQRGRTGGYVTGRAAEAIRVTDIIEAVEGPLAVAACVEGTHASCEFERSCPMNGRWDPVNRVIRQALDNVTLADMALAGFAAGARPPAAPASATP